MRTEAVQSTPPERPVIDESSGSKHEDIPSENLLSFRRNYFADDGFGWSQWRQRN